MDKSEQQNSFKNVLRKGGFKATPARLAILEIFKKSKQPLAAQEIIDALPRDTDQATVYRTLKSLKLKGIIRQVDLRHNHAHYELASVDEHHHHIICIHCGKIEDVPHAGARTLETAVLRESKFFAEIQQHSLEFYGICKTCARKNELVKIFTHKNAPL